MKKAAIAFILCLSIYIIYRDVTTGTLGVSMKTTANHERAAKEIPYKTVTVTPGDTLLSIMEKQQHGPLPVSIDKAIADFEALNPGEKAQTLKIGKKYKIPVYKR